MDGDVTSPAAAVTATPKKLKLGRPEMKKSKKELKAEIKWILPNQPYERIEARATSA